MIENTPESIHGGICAWAVYFLEGCPEWLDVPRVVYTFQYVLWGGLIFSVLRIGFGIWKDKKLATLNGIGENKTVSAYEAVRLLADARPNSDETTGIWLRDEARLGNLRAWGRPIPKMALPDHIPSVNRIPPDVWEYAEIDTSLIYGPLPQSKMKYIQQYKKPYIEDDRMLYDAVRFNKKEVTDLCLAVNT